MNKKVLGFALTIFFLVLLATPVMAETTKGLKVPASMTAGPQVPGTPPPVRRWRTNGDIRQSRGVQTDYYPITLTIGSDVYPNGYSYNLGNEALNFKTGWLNSRGYAEWTFEGIGGFAGNLEMKLHIFTGWYSIHGVLFGFGDFEGYTLMLSYDGPPVGAVWTGYCLIG